MKKRFTLFAALLLWCSVLMAQTHTISGTIIDRATGETLIGATVVDLRSKQGTVSNVNGRYSITLRSDTVEMRFSYVGYQPQIRTFLWMRTKKSTSHWTIPPTCRPSPSPLTVSVAPSPVR